MRKTQACAIVARKLNLPLGRVSHLVQRASEGGVLPMGRGGDRPDLSSIELARLLLAAVADRGLGVASQSVQEFGALQTPEGLVLVDLLEAMVSGRASVSGLQSIIVQLDPAGVSVTTAGHHFRFGADHAGGAAKQVVIRGEDLAAAILEFRGYSPREADEAVAARRSPSFQCGQSMTIGILKSFGGGGFGFFGVDGAADVFVHRNQFDRIGASPVIDARYEFEIKTGMNGKRQATNLRALDDCD
jgi:cold shock CspA family protein